MRRLGALPLAVLFLAPLAASLALLLKDFVNAQAFADLFVHPQFPGSLRLSIITGTVSSALALLFAILIITGVDRNLQRDAGPMLAVPHAALTIGMVFLVAPTGAVARAIGTLAGWTSPPAWVTTQDPAGWSLIAALVLKETPFVVWALASLLNRDDLGTQLRSHEKAARALGHGGWSIWLNVLLPQLLPRIAWPLIAVFTYGCTVVDMAIITGPTQPPTLANLIWTDINDSDPVNNARGAAGILTLSGLILILSLVVGLFLRFSSSLVKIFFLQYSPSQNLSKALGAQIWGFWRAFYAMAVLFLVLASFSGTWPFPNLSPSAFTTKAWSQLATSATPLVNSLILAMTTTVAATAAIITWFETQPQQRDRFILTAAAVTLCLPSLVIGLGQYRLFLQLGITGTALAMLLAHILPVAAYIFVMLNGPYRAFDPRWQSASNGLLKARAQFLRSIKWPMLKAPILSAAAVGFAVSIAQYVPAQLASAGRYTTLPIEAVTLTAGGNRALIATYALALMALPLLAFLAASWLSRPRYA